MLTDAQNVHATSPPRRCGRVSCAIGGSDCRRTTARFQWVTDCEANGSSSTCPSVECSRRARRGHTSRSPFAVTVVVPCLNEADNVDAGVRGDRRRARPVRRAGDPVRRRRQHRRHAGPRSGPWPSATRRVVPVVHPQLRAGGGLLGRLPLRAPSVDAAPRRRPAVPAGRGAQADVAGTRRATTRCSASASTARTAGCGGSPPALHDLISRRLLRIEIPAGGTSFRLVRTDSPGGSSTWDWARRTSWPPAAADPGVDDVADRPPRPARGEPKVTVRGLARHAVELFMSYSTGRRRSPRCSRCSPASFALARRRSRPRSPAAMPPRAPAGLRWRGGLLRWPSSRALPGPHRPGASPAAAVPDPRGQHPGRGRRTCSRHSRLAGAVRYERARRSRRRRRRHHAPLETARRLGLRTICVDARTDAPAVGYADEFLNLSTRDVDALAGVLAATREDIAASSRRPATSTCRPSTRWPSGSACRTACPPARAGLGRQGLLPRRLRRPRPTRTAASSRAPRGCARAAPPA